MDKGGAGAESKINNIGSATLEKGFVVAIKKRGIYLTVQGRDHRGPPGR